MAKSATDTATMSTAIVTTMSTDTAEATAILEEEGEEESAKCIALSRTRPKMPPLLKRMPEATPAPPLEAEADAENV